MTDQPNALLDARFTIEDDVFVEVRGLVGNLIYLWQTAPDSGDESQINLSPSGALALAEALSSRLSRPTQPSGEANDALAKALCLLDTFGGEGLGHVYGNGQTIDADTCCAELAAAFGVELEAGWYRKVAALATRPAHGADEEDAEFAARWKSDWLALREAANHGADKGEAIEIIATIGQSNMVVSGSATTPAREAIEAAAKVAEEFGHLSNEEYATADFDERKCHEYGHMIARQIRALALPSNPGEPDAWSIDPKYCAPVVSFDVTGRYYLASCDVCGWVGSSEHCGTDSGGDDSDVYCPRCHHSGADCGKVAEKIGTPPAASGYPVSAEVDAAMRKAVDTGLEHRYAPESAASGGDVERIRDELVKTQEANCTLLQSILNAIDSGRSEPLFIVRDQIRNFLSTHAGNGGQSEGGEA